MAFIPTEEHLKAPQLNERVDYDVIDKQLAEGIDSHLAKWFADKQIKESGSWIKIGNKGSLSVNKYDGHWHSHETDDKGKGLLSLYAWRYAIDLETAASDLGNASKIVEFRQTRKDAPKPEAIQQWEHSKEKPTTDIDSHFDLGKADSAYRYRDLDGNPIGVVLRWDATKERGKEIRPVSWVQMAGKESPEWKWCGFAEPRPLYRGELIKQHPDMPIIIVEGEKAADALASVLKSHIVITWCGGTGQIGKADFAGLIGRDVTIWPDNDEAGQKAAAQIKEIIQDAKTIPIPAAAPPKWDAADAIAAGMDEAALQKFVATATDFDDIFVDLETIFEGDMEPERPTIAASDSGDCLLYAGRINEIHGEPSVGKTNLTIAIMACELRMGQKVMFIDPEDNPNGILRRMLSFGISKEMILANLYYLHDPTPEEIIKAQQWARRHKPSLVDCDGLAETITACQFKEDSSNEILEFFRTYIRPFTECGAAVLLSDHVVKSSEGRGLWSRGSGAKMGRYDGVSYSVTLSAPYSPKQKGSVKFTIAKDRNGGIGTKGEEVFMAFFEPNGEGITDVSIRRLKPGDGISNEIWEQLEAMHVTIKAVEVGVSATSLIRDCRFGIPDSDAPEGFRRVDITDRDKATRRDQLVKMGLIEMRKEGNKKTYFATGKAFPDYKADL